jgi:CHAT domain-containing protein
MHSIDRDIRARLSQDSASFNPQDLLRVGKQIIDAQENTVLINIFLTEEKTWLLWTSEGGIVKSESVPVGRQQLAETVVQFRQLLQTADSDLNQVKATGQKLYQWLIKPLELELKRNQITNLVFSLDRATRYIPMSALYDGQQYLVENYNIHTILAAGLTDTSDRLPRGCRWRWHRDFRHQFLLFRNRSQGGHSFFVVSGRCQHESTDAVH